MTIPEAHWQDLMKTPLDETARRAWATIDGQNRLELIGLGRTIRVDVAQRLVQVQSHHGWQPCPPDLTLMTLVYLKDVGPATLSGEYVGIQDLKDAHFFQGPHALPLNPLIECFGDDPEGLTDRARVLGGSTVAMADVGARLWIYPKIPVLFLLYQADAEFSAGLSVLLDRSVESHLAADALWGMLNLTTDALLSVS